MEKCWMMSMMWMNIHGAFPAFLDFSCCETVITPVGWSIRLSVFKYLKDCLLFFSIFCLKGHQMNTKVTRARFLKTNLGGIFWGFLCIQPLKFYNFIFMISSPSSNSLRKLHVRKKSGSGCIVGTRPLFLRLNRFFVFLVFFTLCQ